MLDSWANWIAVVVGPVLGLFAGLAIINYVWQLVDCVSSGRAFRTRGFTKGDALVIDGEDSILICSNVMSTEFLILDCPKHTVRDVRNDRLRFMDVRWHADKRVEQ